MTTLLTGLPQPTDLPDASTWPTEGEVRMDIAAAPVTGPIRVVTAPTAHHAHVGAMQAVLVHAAHVITDVMRTRRTTDLKALLDAIDGTGALA